jgi:nitrate reductase gamma subunit
MTPAFDLLLFVVLPYAAIVVCAAASVERYRRHGFSVTSHSSQFLENRLHFWALVPFHFGILIVAAGHLAAFLLPRQVLAWNALAVRSYILETATLAGGLLALVGLGTAIVRRARVVPVRRATTALDWIVYAMLLAQLATGVSLAVRYPWGASWFAAAAAPYLWSLVRLQPDVTFAAAMPLLVRLHIVGAWLLLAVFPFSRLVHIVVVPIPYLWRAPQVVRWYGRPAVASGRKS